MRIHSSSFETADAVALSYSHEKFDCVLIANALHIMPKPDEVMKEIYRVLKPNGNFVRPHFSMERGKAKKNDKKFDVYFRI